MKNNIIQLKRVSIACPSLWEGETSKGDNVKIRFRDGELSLFINKEEHYKNIIGGNGDSFIDNKAMMEFLQDNIIFEIPVKKNLINQDNEGYFNSIENIEDLFWDPEED